MLKVNDIHDLYNLGQVHTCSLKSDQKSVTFLAKMLR